MTEEQKEELLNDAEFVVTLLSNKGPKHTIGALTLALACAYTALPKDVRDEALSKQGDLFAASLEVFKEHSLVN